MADKKKIVIFGNGEIAEVCYFYFKHDSDYEVVAFTVDEDYISDDSLLGLPVVPFEKVESLYPPSDYAAYVAIGFSKRNRVRQQKYEEVKAKGYSLVSYVSSKATVWPGLKVGENSFIFEDNTIQPFTEIGDNTILWSGNHIGHHTTIGSHCFITSHVVVSGGVDVGNNCFIGVNATLRDHIAIGAFSIIGAGALILENTAENSVYPAQGTEASVKKA